MALTLAASHEGRIAMNPPYTHISDLAAQAEPPAQGILSRTIYHDEQLKAIVFGFDGDQELFPSWLAREAEREPASVPTGPTGMIGLGPDGGSGAPGAQAGALT